MNILQIKYLPAICLLLILQPIQVFTQNQISHHLIIDGETKQVISTFVTLIKEELPAGEFGVGFNKSSLLGWQAGINHYPFSGTYLYQSKVYSANGETGDFIRTKK